MYQGWSGVAGNCLIVTAGVWVCHRQKLSMMTSWTGNIFRVIGPLCGNLPVTGEFPSERPVMQSFGVFLDLHLNKQFSKQSWGWWFETLSRPLWRHCNGNVSAKCNQLSGEMSHPSWHSVELCAVPFLSTPICFWRKGLSRMVDMLATAVGGEGASGI